MGTEDYGLPVVQISVKWANELLATAQKIGELGRKRSIPI